MITNKVRSVSFTLVLATMLVGCNPTDRESVNLDGVVGTPRSSIVISGEEALSLYGITPDPAAMPTPTLVDQAWFPRGAWVTASVLPYEDQAPIRILPVYSSPGLDVDGTWLGDLGEGVKVEILGVDPNGRSCYVIGDAVQGWSVEGWVACNRLLFEEPTIVPKHK